ncbi:hypothetical protein NQZ68_017892 [Dissostichus eleginoides]|nr:hypothetical protein NQZ68_017892 [Dissostichus eleginoides]
MGAGSRGAKGPKPVHMHECTSQVVAQVLKPIALHRCMARIVVGWAGSESSPPPVQITVDQVSSESLSLHWDTPAGEVESYIVTCCSEGDIMKETTDRNKMTFNNLKPGECYFLEVSTKLRNGRISSPTVTSANTNVPPPGEVTVLNSDQETVSLCFPPTENSAGFRLQLDYSCETHSGSLTVDDSSPVKVDGLIPGTEYTFSITRIADNGNQSKATSLSVFTEPSPPVQITVDQVSSESLSLHWDPLLVKWRVTL